MAFKDKALRRMAEKLNRAGIPYSVGAGWLLCLRGVTDSFHELRASLIAKDCGLKAKSVPAKTPWYLAPSYWVREWMAVAGYLIFG